jgi:PEGA domain
MRKQAGLRGTLMQSWKSGSVLLLISLVPCAAHAQATTGSAGTSTSTGGTYTVMGGTTSSQARPQTQSKSPHLLDPGGPSAEEINRKALAQRAGSDGGKLLLRSTPSGAQVFLDGAFVGHTPLLVIVPPGKYEIQMNGPREEFGERTVGLAAKETQEILLTLPARYPEHVATR